MENDFPFGKRLKCHCSAVFFLVLVAVCLIALTIGFVVTMFPSVCIIINILHCDDCRYSIYIDWRSVFSSFSPVLFFFECDSFYPLKPCPVSLKLVLVLTAFVRENTSAMGELECFWTQNWIIQLARFWSNIGSSLHLASNLTAINIRVQIKLKLENHCFLETRVQQKKVVNVLICHRCRWTPGESTFHRPWPGGFARADGGGCAPQARCYSDFRPSGWKVLPALPPSIPRRLRRCSRWWCAGPACGGTPRGDVSSAPYRTGTNPWTIWTLICLGPYCLSAVVASEPADRCFWGDCLAGSPVYRRGTFHSPGTAGSERTRTGYCRSCSRYPSLGRTFWGGFRATEGKPECRYLEPYSTISNTLGWLNERKQVEHEGLECSVLFYGFTLFNEGCLRCTAKVSLYLKHYLRTTIKLRFFHFPSLGCKFLALFSFRQTRTLHSSYLYACRYVWLGVVRFWNTIFTNGAN